MIQFKSFSNKVQVQQSPKFKQTYKTVKLIFGNEARSSLLQGIQRLATAASLTLGPGGRNVALEYEGGDPKITKDGVTVVKSVMEPTREREMGAKLAKKIAGNTNTYAGDGTTTSTLLSKSIIQKAFNAIQFGGAHPIALKRGLDLSMMVVLGYLKEIAMDCKDQKEIQDVCMVSSNYNTQIAEIVAHTMIQVGLNGVVNICESPIGITRMGLINGLIFERGFVSDAFLQEGSLSCELENPLVLVVSNKITQVKEITAIMDIAKKINRPLVVFSEDLQEEPLGTMVYNNSKDILQCIAVNVPWLAGIQKEMLQDIAVMTGSTIIDNDIQIKLNSTDLNISHFGSAKKIVIDSAQTQIVGGNCKTSTSIAERLQQIMDQINNEQSHHLKGVHRERYARLNQQIAEIQVGGMTDSEKGEIRDLVVDSLNSAKSAMINGILPGGGIALYKASKLLEDGLPALVNEESEKIGVKIMSQVLKDPLKTIITNKLGDGKYQQIIEQIESKNDIFYGFDAKQEKLCDLIDAGVIDSYNVVKAILQDSVSLAGLLITTECLVVKEKNYTPLPLKHYQDRREFF